MPDDNLHLTLAFLGEQPESLAQDIAQRINTLQIAAGQWRLSRWGYFSGPGIVWVGGDYSSPLQRLHDSLWSELEVSGINGRPQSFVPHITLLRRARPLPETGLPAPSSLAWHYQRLALVHSTVGPTGSHYRVLAHSAEAW